MDLFHAITQSIDQILTCHFLEGFNSYKMSDNSNDDKKVDTVPGGESTQYVYLFSMALTSFRWMTPVPNLRERSTGDLRD